MSVGFGQLRTQLSLTVGPDVPQEWAGGEMTWHKCGIVALKQDDRGQAASNQGGQVVAQRVQHDLSEMISSRTYGIGALDRPQMGPMARRIGLTPLESPGHSREIPAIARFSDEL